MRKKYLLILQHACIMLSIFLSGGSLAEETVQRSGVVEFPPPAPVLDKGAVIRGVGSNVNVTQHASPQNETSIAVDPANPLNLAAGTNDYRYGDAGAGIAYSLDGGATWISDTLAGLHPTHGKFDAQGDPAIAPYRNGVFYYAFIDFSRTSDENRLAVARTMDGGMTWPLLGVIADHTGSGSHDFEDKEYIAVDTTGGTYDGNVYVSWTRFPVFGDTRILFTSSTDGGISYSFPVQISDTTGGYQGSVPVVGPNGEVYVAWYHSDSIEIDKSTDGGVSWGTDVLVANIDKLPSPLPGASFRVNSFPTIAVDQSNGPDSGSVYIAWADDQGTGMGPDILFSRSTDGGATWSLPVRISDDANQTYQWFPWMSVSPAGYIDVIFYDRRDMPGSIQFHTYHTQSVDGGLSFSPNVRITEEISVATNDGFGGAFIGDYNGICTTPDTAYPFWTDLRNSNGNAEGYTAAISADPVPDIRANGLDSPVTINKGDSLVVDAALDPGSRAGEDGDWWLLVNSPFGWYHYEFSTGSWKPGFHVTRQGPLFVFNPYEVLNVPSLPRGRYVFHFGVDLIMDGSPDLDQSYFDSVIVDVI